MKAKLKDLKKIGKNFLKIKPKKRNPKKTIINKLDTAFSLIIRKRAQCEKCGRGNNLQCSHIHSREKKSVRWDLLNAFCLCSGCHLYWWHKHPIEAAEFTKSKLGIEEYDALNYRAETIKQWSIEEMEYLLSEFKKELTK